MKNFSFKKILAILIGLVILFIPTYIAIAAYNAEKPHIGEVNNITVLTLRDPEGRSFVITSEDDPNDIIGMFNSINQSGSPVASLPDNMSGSEFLLVTYSRQNEETSYKYYFSNDSSKCYFADSNGKIFKIAVVQAKQFLGSQYSVYLYKAAMPPVLTFADNKVLNANELVWYYLVSGGTYQQF